MCFLSVFSVPVEADVGPKPSVTITIKQAPEGPYYVTLLGTHAFGPWSPIEEGSDPGIDDAEELAAYQSFAQYKNGEGYFFLGNMSKKMEGNDEFAWTYYPPDPFKIAIYSVKDGKLLVSDAYERNAFYSYFDVSCSNDGLIVKEETHFDRQLINLLIRVIATIAVEYVIAYIFGYREKKERRAIIIANVITQVLLNAILIFVDYYGGLLMWMIMFLLGELAVILIEFIIYLFTLKSHSKARAFAYSLMANLISAALTFALEIISMNAY